MQLLDVREAEEYALGYIDGAVNMPLGELRQRCGELDPEREVIVYCSVGLRSYLAARILMQNGFKRVRTLNGGYKVYRTLAGSAGEHGAGAAGAAPGQAAEEAAAGQETVPAEGRSLDLSGLQCPGPIMQLFRKMSELPEGAPWRSAPLIPACRRYRILVQPHRQPLSQGLRGQGFYGANLQGSGATAAARPGRLLQSFRCGDDKTIIVFSGDLDRAMAALIIANGAPPWAPGDALLHLLGLEHPAQERGGGGSQTVHGAYVRPDDAAGSKKWGFPGCTCSASDRS